LISARCHPVCRIADERDSLAHRFLPSAQDLRLCAPPCPLW
jgi:hypothetical protein